MEKVVKIFGAPKSVIEFAEKWLIVYFSQAEIKCAIKFVETKITAGTDSIKNSLRSTLISTHRNVRVLVMCERVRVDIDL